MKTANPRQFRSFTMDKAVPSLIQFSALAIVLTLVAVPVARAQTFSVIHTFTGSGGDGANPESGVTLRGGVLYGTTYGGGIGGPGNRVGTVYQMTHVGSDWIYTPIFFFRGDGVGGANPTARVVFGPDGHLYGTASFGGSTGNGVVFALTPPLAICKTLSCLWKENVLHNFLGQPADGSTPSSGDLAWDQQGNIYGTTGRGGSGDYGTAFQMNPGTNTYSVIHNFMGNDGRIPNGVIVDKSGSLYGTTEEGGVQGFYGTVFELTYVNDWTETILHNFTSQGDGYGPYAGLVADRSGNLYGATTSGGNGPYGGTIFELSPAGDTWTFNVLYSFSGGGGPYASLTIDAAGNLYGTTAGDGAYRGGNVFKLTNTANGWVYTSLHDFPGGLGGSDPQSQVAIDTDGTLYGTTYYGGGGNCGYLGCGVVWMIKP